MRAALKLVLCLLLMLSGRAAIAAETVLFVTIPPQRWLVQELAGELVQVEVMVEPGQNPHTFEPSGRQIAALARARGWLTIGMPFEQTLLTKAKRSLPQLRDYPIYHSIERLTSGATPHKHAPGEVCHDDGSDPHLWLSVSGMSQLATNACLALQELLPQQREALADSLQRLAGKLQRLQEELAAVLAPCAGRSFWVYHPSWGYFARSFGLQQVAIEEAGREPTPRQLAQLVARAKREGISVLYGDPQLDPRPLRIVAAQLGAQVELLDPLAEAWEHNMRHVAHLLAAGMERTQVVGESSSDE